MGVAPVDPATTCPGACFTAAAHLQWICRIFSHAENGCAAIRHGAVGPEQKRIFWDDAGNSLVLSGSKGFPPLRNPPDFQPVADEMDRLHDFKRTRPTVEDCVKAHYAQMIPQPGRKPRTYRRFRRAHVGEP
jgi:hypothetical protein